MKQEGRNATPLELVDAEYYEKEYEKTVKKYHIDDYFTADTYENEKHLIN